MFPTDHDITRQITRHHGPTSPATETASASPQAKPGKVGLRAEQRVQATPAASEAASYHPRPQVEAPATRYPFAAGGRPERATGHAGALEGAAATARPPARAGAEAAAETKAQVERLRRASRPPAGQQRPSAPPPSSGDLGVRAARIAQRLQTQDRSVRAHEHAHAAHAGRYGGPPNFDLSPGPDGRIYAVGGEVPIDTAPVSGDPAATITKMQVVRRRALDPAGATAADRALATQVSRQEAHARRELMQQRAAERQALMREIAERSFGVHPPEDNAGTAAEPHMAEAVAGSRAFTQYADGAPTATPGVKTRA